MASKLLTAVRKLDNLEKSWRVIQENARTSKSEEVRDEIEEFAEDAARNLRSLKGRLGSGTFRFPPAKGVPIFKLDAHGKKTSKFRPIVLAPVESRIVQRAILNVLEEVEALRPYIRTPYSFGGIRARRKKASGEKHTDAKELAAVPAAIAAILKEIGEGARFIACADISGFFTRISKSEVTEIIASATGHDAEFIEFFKQAIDVELSNIANLRERTADFPIEEIGVAQGSSLSPLLGNILLAPFDAALNDGSCRCIRYIDDFIILGPTARETSGQMLKAKALLSKLNMELSPGKSSVVAKPVKNGFDFLGINICPGLIRPTKVAQARFLASLDKAFNESQRAMLGAKSGQRLSKAHSMIGTLKRINGMIDGWGKHYWFCNDATSFGHLDTKLTEKLREFMGRYRDVRLNSPVTVHASLLGISELSVRERQPFSYPSVTITK